MTDLTVAFSVLVSDFISQKENLLGYFDELESCSVEWMLIVQGEEEKPANFVERDTERIIWSTDIGLSKSRNIALREYKTRYLICADWDTRYAIDLLQGLSSEARALENEVPFYRFGILRADDFEASYREKIGQTKNQVFGLQKDSSALALTNIASWQICWDLDFIRKYSLNFDEALGLGSKSIWPSFGEEYLLALQCWAISGSYGQTPVLIGVTRDLSTGMHASKVDKVLLSFYVFLRLAKSHPVKSSAVILQRVKRFFKA